MHIKVWKEAILQELRSDNQTLVYPKSELHLTGTTGNYMERFVSQIIPQNIIFVIAKVSSRLHILISQTVTKSIAMKIADACELKKTSHAVVLPLHNATARETAIHLKFQM